MFVLNQMLLQINNLECECNKDEYPISYKRIPN